MNVLQPRQQQILALAREQGRVVVLDLADQLGVSVQTIRKDLNDLCERKQLQRIHGGALLPTAASNVAYESRRTLAAEEKRAIGFRAASLIPNNSAVILNIGTTTEQVATALRGHQGLMVVTNNINVANILRDVPTIDVLITGGIVRPSDGGITGASAIDFIRQFRFDVAVIGTSAIDPDGLLLDYDFREVRVTQEILRQSRRSILVADSTKLVRSAPVQIADLSEVDVLVTDHPLPETLARFCSDHNVEVEITDHAPEQSTGLAS